MDKQVPKSGHIHQTVKQFAGEDVLLSQHGEDVSVIRWRAKTSPRDEMIADVEAAFDRQLKETFRCSAHKVIR